MIFIILKFITFFIIEISKNNILAKYIVSPKPLPLHKYSKPNEQMMYRIIQILNCSISNNDVMYTGKLLCNQYIPLNRYERQAFLVWCPERGGYISVFRLHGPLFWIKQWMKMTKVAPIVNFAIYGTSDVGQTKWAHSIISNFSYWTVFTNKMWRNMLDVSRKWRIVSY